MTAPTPNLGPAVSRAGGRAWACAGIAAVLLGCPPRPIELGPRGEVTDPLELLALVQRAEALAHGLDGEGRLTVDSPQGSGTVGLLALAQAPDRLQLVTLDFFNRPSASLVVGGARFGVYRADEGRYYTGPATAENLRLILPIALPPDDLVAMLLGRAPRLSAVPRSLALDREAGAYRLELRGGGREQTLWVHPLHYRVVRSQLRGPDAYDLSFHELAPLGGGVFPRALRIEAQGARLRLQYTALALDPPLDEEAFEVAPPVGIPVIELDAGGQPLPGGPLGSGS